RRSAELGIVSLVFSQRKFLCGLCAKNPPSFKRKSLRTRLSNNDIKSFNLHNDQWITDNV
ncbi:MAG TPA: hypothetical protein VFD46_07655, partial [Chryseolinea sp.]|nr:hypothetical protein [Chryseolinea sp.]